MAILVTNGLPAQAGSMDLTALTDKARSAVMLMVIANESGLEVATGTGFLVSSDGKLITNRHVATAGATAFAKARNTKRYRVLGVLAEDHEHDLVLLQIDAKDLPYLPLGSSEKVETGQPVAVVGNPLGWEGILAQGVVLDVQEFLGERGWIQVRVPINHGSSGSPVLNSNGQVIGVITVMMQKNHTQGLAIPVEIARRLLDASRSATTPKPLSQLAERGAEDVFLDKDFLAAASACFSKDFDEAQKRVEVALTHFPNSAVVHLLQGHVYEERGSYDDAIAACQRAIKLKPEYVSAWCGLGSAYRRQHKYSEACDAFVQAAKLKPNYFEAWDNLGWAYIQQGKYGNASDAYKQASQLRPNDEEVWYNLGVCYGKQARYDHAAWAYKVAVQLKSDRPELWRELGTAYAKQEQYAMAADAFEHSAKLKPQDAVTWFNLGLAYSQFGKRDNAQAALERLRKLDPKKAEELEKLVGP